VNRKFEFQTESIREETISRIESLELSNQKCYFIKAEKTIEQEVNESCFGVVLDVFLDGSSVN
jgi:hypothetical protein